MGISVYSGNKIISGLSGGNSSVNDDIISTSTVYSSDKIEAKFATKEELSNVENIASIEDANNDMNELFGTTGIVYFK